MADPQSYVRNLTSINDSIKRHNQQLKILRAKKMDAQRRLHTYMVRNNLADFEGYNQTKIAPKVKLPVKKKADKKADAIRLFTDVGISDPEILLDAFQRTQKYTPSEESDY